MEDRPVNIAKNLVENGVKVLMHRPPSGSRTHSKHIASIRRQLSVTSRNTEHTKHSQLHTSGLTRQQDEEQSHSVGPRRPESAKARLINNNNDPAELKCALAKPRPQSAKSAQNVENSKHADSGSELEPFVYGYKSQRKMCGSDTDVRKNAYGGDLACQYKLAEPVFETKNQTPASKSSHEKNKNKIETPKNLRPLEPWLTPHIPERWIGVDPTQCLIFLPSLLHHQGDLPVVPPHQKACDELPFISAVSPPVQAVPTKKYPHPWTRRPVNEWVCDHAGPKSPLKIYSATGKLLHETRTRGRTVEVIRQEIEELENLMEGVGDPEGSSIVVQYQADLNHIQDMLDQTRDRVQEIQRRDNAKLLLENKEPTDLCGLRAFCRDHDEVIAEIKVQHDNCVQELARLEDELQIDIARGHFRHFKVAESAKVIEKLDTTRVVDL